MENWVWVSVVWFIVLPLLSGRLVYEMYRSERKWQSYKRGEITLREYSDWVTKYIGREDWEHPT
jgi:hypothetical protein